MEKCTNQSVEQFVDSFRQDNRGEGLRVFVAGGSRSGLAPIYVEECYNLGRKIAKMDFRLDFGLSSSGIMGAVARGVLDGWNKKQCAGAPIQGITTKEYYVRGCTALLDAVGRTITKVENAQAHTLEDCAAGELCRLLSEPRFRAVSPQVDPQVAARFYTGAMLSLIRWWLSSDDPLPAGHLLANLERFIPIR